MITHRIKNLKHFFRAIQANIKYRFPSRKLTLIGLTGTDGKTTTSNMVYHILKKRGYKVGIISTVTLDTGNGPKINQEHFTTPDTFHVQRLLRECADNKLTHVVVEASSHGLDQHRLLGCRFKVSAITNLTREHLDYHHTMEKYLKSKAKLFSMSNISIFNDGDSSYKTLKNMFPRHLSYSLNGKHSDISLRNTKVNITVPGEYNIKNALASIAVVTQLGVDKNHAIEAMKSFKLPLGRFEIVQSKPFLVVNDFAHTPNGIKNLFMTLKKNKSTKLIHVFGCPGKRDDSKRRLMGRTSSLHSDIIILTAEDPRDEPVSNINSQIKSGFHKMFSGKVLEIEDREKAIQKAVSLARPNDVLLFTGKGPERTQELASGAVSWDETKTIKKYLANHSPAKSSRVLVKPS